MTFYSRVYNEVSKIPPGKVAIYSFIATLLDKPRSARQVGWALMNIPKSVNIPWWRVVNSKGFLSIKNPHVPKEAQRDLLEKDGVTVSDKFIVDLKRFHWKGI